MTPCWSREQKKKKQNPTLGNGLLQCHWTCVVLPLACALCLAEAWVRPLSFVIPSDVSFKTKNVYFIMRVHSLVLERATSDLHRKHACLQEYSGE